MIEIGRESQSQESGTELNFRQVCMSVTTIGLICESFIPNGLFKALKGSNDR